MRSIVLASVAALVLCGVAEADEFSFDGLVAVEICHSHYSGLNSTLPWRLQDAMPESYRPGYEQCAKLLKWWDVKSEAAAGAVQAARLAQDQATIAKALHEIGKP